MKKTGIVLFMTGVALLLCVACGDRNTGSGTVSEKDGIIQDETEEELAYDDDGLPFVKNQIIIYSDYETDKEEVEDLIDDIGGETIEYFDEMNFWLVKLEGEWSYEELEELIEQLNQNPVVFDAGLNYISGEIQENQPWK